MKKVLLVSFIFLTSCVRGFSTDTDAGKITVKIPWYTRQSSENGKYELQDVPLTEVQDIKSMTGAFAKFFFSPSSSGGALSGFPPQAHFFRNQAGTYIAKDHTTLQMATVYAVMERMFQLDREVGAEGVNRYPRDVGINVVQTDHGLLVRNNAYYEGRSDSILLLTYSNENLPIPFNSGILAHEHFHSLFYKMVIKKLKEEKQIDVTLPDSPHEPMAEKKKAHDEETEAEVRAAYTDVLLRGLNEGFADYWAFLFTGDPDFITASIPALHESRSLLRKSDVGPRFVYRQSEIKSEILKIFQRSSQVDDELVDLSYALGTSYSRFLKSLADKVAESRGLEPAKARFLVGRSVILSLQSLVSEVSEKSKVEFIRPERIYQSLFTQIPGPAGLSECNLVKEYLQAVVENPKEFGDCEAFMNTYRLKQIETKQIETKNLKISNHDL